MNYEARVLVRISSWELIVGRSHLVTGQYNNYSLCGQHLGSGKSLSENEAKRVLKKPVVRCKTCEKILAKKKAEEKEQAKKNRAKRG